MDLINIQNHNRTPPLIFQRFRFLKTLFNIFLENLQSFRKQNNVVNQIEFDCDRSEILDLTLIARRNSQKEITLKNHTNKTICIL
jgi:hypothetical protein